MLVRREGLGRGNYQQFDLKHRKQTVGNYPVDIMWDLLAPHINKIRLNAFVESMERVGPPDFSKGLYGLR